MSIESTLYAAESALERRHTRSLELEDAPLEPPHPFAVVQDRKAYLFSPCGFEGVIKSWSWTGIMWIEN